MNSPGAVSRSRCPGWLVVAVALSALAGCSAPRIAEAPTGPHFSILTYNLDRTIPDSGPSLAVVRDGNADIAVLQEVTPACANEINAYLADLYPYVAVKPYERGGGLVVLSKSPFHERAYIPSPSGKYPAWLVSVETPLGQVELLVVHLHPPVNRQCRFTLAAWFSRGRERLREITCFAASIRSDRPCVVVGDFNENDRGGAVRFLTSRAFTDALGEFDRTSCTWSLWRGLKLISARTDHILYSDSLHCFDARVLDSWTSDHRPVVAVLGPVASPAP